MFALASISAVQVPPVLVLKKDHGLCSIAAANDESVVHLTAPCYLSCYGGTCRCRCCCGVIPLWLLSLVVVVHVTAFFSISTHKQLFSFFKGHNCSFFSSSVWSRRFSSLEPGLQAGLLVSGMHSKLSIDEAQGNLNRFIQFSTGALIITCSMSFWGFLIIIVVIVV